MTKKNRCFLSGLLCAVLLAVTAAWCAALLGAAASAAEGGPAVRSRFRVKNFTVS